MPIPLSNNSRGWAVQAAKALNAASSEVADAIGAEDSAVSIAYLNNAKAKLVEALEAITSAKVTA